MVVEDVPQVATHVRSLLIAQAQIKVLDVIPEGDGALSALNELRPDVVIVDALLQGKTSGLHVARSIRQHDPSVGLIMLTVPQNPVDPNPEAGIDTVLRMPFSGFDLTTAIRLVTEQRAAGAARGRSLLVSLFSPKGGVGRTTLAYNLAVALVGDQPVCLIDGSLQFGDLRGLLRVPPTTPSIADLPTERVRESDLSEVMWRDPSGIDVLLAPPRIEMAEMITTKDLESVVSLLRKLYAFVIVDTRAALTEDVLVFLDASDLILQVISFDAMAVRSLAMTRETFEAIGYPQSKLATVLNRSDASGGITRAEVENAIGHRVEYEVVSDGRLVLAANNEGVPFVSASPDAPITAGVRAIAAALRARSEAGSALRLAH